MALWLHVRSNGHLGTFRSGQKPKRVRACDKVTTGNIENGMPTSGHQRMASIWKPLNVPWFPPATTFGRKSVFPSPRFEALNDMLAGHVRPAIMRHRLLNK